MVDPIVGLIVVVAIVGVAAVAAFWSRRSTPYHPLIDVAGLVLPPGLVVFTSTNCHRCKDVLAVARSVDAPLREVTFELESELQERAGVTGVPLTVVIDSSGAVVSQFAGPVRLGSLRRAVGRAGL